VERGDPRPLFVCHIQACLRLRGRAAVQLHEVLERLVVQVAGNAAPLALLLIHIPSLTARGRTSPGRAADGPPPHA
jgi:hypothetical protein